jgi:DNA-binding response OmpR family regulator
MSLITDLTGLHSAPAPRAFVSDQTWWKEVRQLGCCHPRKTIVAVDDSRGILHLLQAFLEPAGYTVTTADTADEGYRLIRELHPDLAILDVRIPPAPAWQVINQVHEDPATADVALLICSASSEALEQRAAWLTAQGYQTLLKPFRGETLLEQVRRSLDRAARPHRNVR